VAPGRYDGEVNLTPLERFGAVLVAIATPCVIIGLSVLVFLNPIWVGFEQDRSNVDRLTGYTATQVHQVTGSILSDLIFGPPNFAVTVNGLGSNRAHCQPGNDSSACQPSGYSSE